MSRAMLVIAGILLAAETQAAQTARQPVLVELFTSEGCSSCPPADALLAQLDGQAIVLSEHVDYWNHGGWSDPYSSAAWSDRQRAYANRLRVDSVYTPQMVVDGSVEFVGSNAAKARSAIAKAAQGEKAAIRLSVLPSSSAHTLLVRVDVDALSPELQKLNPEVFLSLAMNEATTQVGGGENGGRRLQHVAVVRQLVPAGRIQPGKAFSSEVALPVGKGLDVSQLRIVAFAQERDHGRIIGSQLTAAK